MKNFLKTLAFIAPILAIAFIFRHVVTPGYFYGNGDIIYNFFEYFNHFAHHGPIVSQDILSGFPIQVSVAGVWYYPVNRIVLAFFDPYTAYKIIDISNLILAYVLTYLYARKIQFGHAYAIIAGFIFITSGQLMLWAETITNSNYFFLLPLGLLCVEYFFQAKRVSSKVISILVLGLGLGVGWLSGHVQFIVYIHTFVLIYFFYKWFKDKPTNFFAHVGSLIIAYIISFIVGFAQIATILAYKTVSVRAGGVSVDDFYWGAYLPQDFIRYFLPFYKIAVLPFSNPNLYVGIISFAFLVIGYVYWTRQKHHLFKFFGCVYIFCLIFSLRNSPVGLLSHSLPFWNSFRESPRIMFIGGFAAAFIIAYTVRFIFEEREQMSLENIGCFIKKILTYIVIPLGFIFSISLLFADRVEGVIRNYFISHLYAHTAQLPHEHYFALIHSYTQELLGQLSFLNIHYVVLTTGLVFLVWFFSSNLRYSRPGAVYIILAVMILDITITYGNYYHGIKTAQLVQEPQSAQFLKTVDPKNEYRYLSIMPGFTIFTESLRCNNTFEENIELQKELLQPNINMLYGVSAVDGYDNFMPKDISDLLGYVGSEQSLSENLLANESIPPEEKVQKIIERRNILRMMNVKYLVSTYPITHSDFVLVKDYLVGKCPTHIFIYELKGVWSRYFLTNTTRNYTDLDSFLSSDLSGPGVNAENLFVVNSSFFTEIVPEYTHDGYIFTIDAPADTYLYIGNAWLPNYIAKDNGNIVDLKKANHAYMYLPVSEGKHMIEITYKSF